MRKWWESGALLYDTRPCDVLLSTMSRSSRFTVVHSYLPLRGATVLRGLVRRR